MIATILYAALYAVVAVGSVIAWRRWQRRNVTQPDTPSVSLDAERSTTTVDLRGWRLAAVIVAAGSIANVVTMQPAVRFLTGELGDYGAKMVGVTLFIPVTLVLAEVIRKATRRYIVLA